LQIAYKTITDIPEQELRFFEILKNELTVVFDIGAREDLLLFNIKMIVNMTFSSQIKIFFKFIGKKYSSPPQCLRNLASSCLWYVNKCVSSAYFQSKLQLFCNLFCFPYLLAARKICIRTLAQGKQQ
jgi:hypothetical protein